MKAADRVIVALDVESYEKGEALVRELAPLGVGFKIGLELINARGAPADRLADLIHELGGWVFWDCKLHDIPTTMERAALQIAARGVRYFTVHASAGKQGMLAVQQVKGAAKMLAVTVLTSFSDQESNGVYGDLPATVVSRLYPIAFLSGAEGIVCSPREIKLIRAPEAVPGTLEVITPGIRPAWAAANDQQRIMTPSEAIRTGATALVIGRPITNPPREIGGPADALRRIIEEIETAAT